MKSLIQKGQIVEMSWVDVLKYFDWLIEWNAVLKYVAESHLIKPAQKDQIYKGYDSHQGFFDLDTVKYYLHLSEINQKLDEASKFNYAVSENKFKVQQQ